MADPTPKSSLGELDLHRLLQGMKPELDPREWVFCTATPEQAGGAISEAIGLFREAEGVTVILEKSRAETLGLAYSGVWSLVTMTVHSSLDAVGFLAAMTARLAAVGISVNAVSAYYHDHLFVPVYQRQRAMAELDGLSRKA